MPPEVAAPESGSARDRQLLPHLAAGQRACLAPTGERGAGLVHECADLVAPASEHLRDLVMPQLLDLGHDEGRALILRQSAEVVDELAQVAAALHFLGQAGRGRRRQLGRKLPARAQNIDAAVASRGVEPGAEMLRRPTLHQLPVGGGEGVLQNILRLLW